MKQVSKVMLCVAIVLGSISIAQAAPVCKCATECPCDTKFVCTTTNNCGVACKCVKRIKHRHFRLFRNRCCR